MFNYLATPYSAYPYGLENAFNAACRAAACLADAGVPVYSPIVHWHPISLFMDRRPTEFWIELNRPHMKIAQGLIIVQLPGWDKSEGIRREQKIFEQLGKPIRYVGWPAVPYRCVFTEAS